MPSIKKTIAILLIGFTFTFSNALAQDADDSYDPFADYSEFEQASDEEADINFFRNGRFFTMGFVGGYRGFTGNMGKLNGSGPSYGLFLSYFFDLRFALQFGFNTSDHPFYISKNNKSLDGNVSFTNMSFDLKYYLNTQNVTRGLADLNPYIIGGFSQNYRTFSITGISEFGRDSTVGVDIGAGVEIPLMRKKAYLGLQTTFNFISFPDENKNIIIPGNTGNSADDVDSNVKPQGDIYNLNFIFGLNF